MKKPMIDATFAYITNSENKVLLIRRARHDTFPGRWEFPGGGLRSGEDVEASIEREVLEEVGLHVMAEQPISVITHVNTDGRNIVRITYACRLLNIEEKIHLSRDHDAYQWMDHIELKNMDKSAPLYEIVSGIRKFQHKNNRFTKRK